MARPMLSFLSPKEKTQEKAAQELRLDSRQTQKQGTKLNQMQIDRILNRKRSKAYMDAVSRLDAGGHMHNETLVREIIDAIRDEMPEIEIDMGPIGIVSKCYLGAPYEVHTIDVAGGIIEHYEKGRPLPSGMERARKLAASEFYVFIEVYHTSLRAVKKDGTVAVIKG